MKSYKTRKNYIKRRKTKSNNKSKSKSRRLRSKIGGTSNINLNSAKPFQMFALPEGASSFREAALINQQNMNNTQQSLINQHGGMYYKKRRNSNTYLNRIGGASNIVVPSFTQGSIISPLNPTTLSISGNKTALQANANAVNDCYATNSCSQSQTGGFRNWYDAFTPCSFGKSLTGGKRVCGSMSGGFTGSDRSIAGKRLNVRDRFPHSGYSAGNWMNE
jgi:hypothetical protein